MIYVTGDIHGNPMRLSRRAFPEQKEMTKDDYVIVLGDFGIVWNYEGKDPSEEQNLDWLEQKNFTTLFIDGNPENFERLYQYPVKEFHGGKVHELRPSVLHLMRGEIFELCDKKIFTFGGARSHDISDGILDPVKDAKKIRKWSKDYFKLFRVNGVSWWPEEMPTEEEMQYGRDNLDDAGWDVDFILSHDCSTSVLCEIYQGKSEINELNKYLDEVKQNCEYTRWFFGHHHVDLQVNEKDIALYRQIVRIA